MDIGLSSLHRELARLAEAGLHAEVTITIAPGATRIPTVDLVEKTETPVRSADESPRDYAERLTQSGSDELLPYPEWSRLTRFSVRELKRAAKEGVLEAVPRGRGGLVHHTVQAIIKYIALREAEMDEPDPSRRSAWAQKVLR
jgi:hypothetical protein